VCHNIYKSIAVFPYTIIMFYAKGAIIMMKMIYNFVEDYHRMIMEENSDNLNMFEVRPGIYSNIDPANLIDCQVADFDLIR